MEERAVPKARRVDTSRNAHGRDCDCALGDHCARSTPEREGRFSLLSDTINGALKLAHRERTSERGEKSLTTSISTRYKCCGIPHVRSSCTAFIVPPTKLIALRDAITVLSKS